MGDPVLPDRGATVLRRCPLAALRCVPAPARRARRPAPRRPRAASPAEAVLRRRPATQREAAVDGRGATGLRADSAVDARDRRHAGRRPARERHADAERSGGLPTRSCRRRASGRASALHGHADGDNAGPATVATATSKRRPRSPSTPQPRVASRRAGCASRGRGFTGAAPVYAHYVSRRQAARRPSGSARSRGRRAARLSAQRRQIPVHARREDPAGGSLQFDQAHRYRSASGADTASTCGSAVDVRIRRADALRRGRLAAGARRACARSAARRRRRRPGPWSPAANSPLQQAERQRVDQVLLDHPLERAGAVGRVVAQVAEQRRAPRRSARPSTPRSAHAADQPRDLEIDDLRAAARA